ncbi:unnamed protein product [Urochloa humidicola]
MIYPSSEKLGLHFQHHCNVSATREKSLTRKQEIAQTKVWLCNNHARIKKNKASASLNESQGKQRPHITARGVVTSKAHP